MYYVCTVFNLLYYYNFYNDLFNNPFLEFVYVNIPLYELLIHNIDSRLVVIMFLLRENEVFITCLYQDYHYKIYINILKNIFHYLLYIIISNIYFSCETIIALI